MYLLIADNAVCEKLESVLKGDCTDYKLDANVPDKLRLIAIDRYGDNYCAGVVTEFSEDRIPAIRKCIQDVEKKGYTIYVDNDVEAGTSGAFYIELFFFNVLEAESLDSFLELCNSLGEKNQKYVQDQAVLWNAIEKNLEFWQVDIYHKIYIKHSREAANQYYNKIPNGCIMIYYNATHYELKFSQLGIEPEIDDVVFLYRVLIYLENKLKKLGGDLQIKMYFNEGGTLEELLPEGIEEELRKEQEEKGFSITDFESIWNLARDLLYQVISEGDMVNENGNFIGWLHDLERMKRWRENRLTDLRVKYLCFAECEELHSITLAEAADLFSEEIMEKYLCEAVPFIRKLMRTGGLTMGRKVANSVPDEFLNQIICTAWKADLMIWAHTWDRERGQSHDAVHSR